VWGIKIQLIQHVLMLACLLQNMDNTPKKPKPSQGGDGKLRVFSGEDGRVAEGKAFGSPAFFVS